MMTPRLDVLPRAGRVLWPSLAQLSNAFVLYGGTALALRLGHRTSVDFEFFTAERLDTDGLFALPLLHRAETLQAEADTLTVSVVPGGADPVKLSFFGGIDIGRVGVPDRTDDDVIWVASMLDLLATKLKVLLQRVSARDYVDIAAILESGVSLADGLGAAVALYQGQFPPMDAVKALGYFAEADAVNVEASARDVLIRHTQAWDRTVPAISKADGTTLGPS